MTLRQIIGVIVIGYACVSLFYNLGNMLASLESFIAYAVIFALFVMAGYILLKNKKLIGENK